MQTLCVAISSCRTVIGHLSTQHHELQNVVIIIIMNNKPTPAMQYDPTGQITSADLYRTITNAQKHERHNSRVQRHHYLFMLPRREISIYGEITHMSNRWNSTADSAEHRVWLLHTGAALHLRRRSACGRTVISSTALRCAGRVVHAAGGPVSACRAWMLQRFRAVDRAEVTRRAQATALRFRQTTRIAIGS